MLLPAWILMLFYFQVGLSLYVTLKQGITKISGFSKSIVSFQR